MSGPGQRRDWAIASAFVLIALLASLEALRREHSPRPVGDAIVVDSLRLRPETFYRVAWGGPSLPDAVTVGATVIALVRVHNISAFTWPDAQLADPAKRNGAGSIRLSHRWLAAETEAVILDYGSRTSLPWPLRSREVVTLPMAIHAPPNPGRYRLQIDLVHELVTWFENRGAARLVVPIVVAPRG